MERTSCKGKNNCMLYFIIPQHSIAAPFIRRYRLKKQMGLNIKFDIFKGESAMLILCGNGAARSAAAAACLLTAFPSKNTDDLLIFLCGQDACSDVSICNKLYDAASEKYFFPFILKEHPFREIETSSLTDYNGVHVFQAACMFMKPEKIVLLKIPSNPPTEEKAIEVAAWLDAYVSDKLKDLPFFSHIYIEKAAENYELTEKIKEKFANSVIIGINHYKDVFSPKNQCFSTQKRSRKLILAVKTSG